MRKFRHILKKKILFCNTHILTYVYKIKTHKKNPQKLQKLPQYQKNTPEIQAAHFL